MDDIQSGYLAEILAGTSKRTEAEERTTISRGRIARLRRVFHARFLNNVLNSRQPVVKDIDLDPDNSPELLSIVVDAGQKASLGSNIFVIFLLASLFT